MKQIIYPLAVLCALVFSVTGQSIPLIRVPRPQNLGANFFNTNVSILDSHEFAYLAQMNIGAQDFLVLLDTGSSDLWVVSSDCDEEDCQSIPKYKPSSTLNLSGTPFELDYLLGSVSGAVGTETVTIGSFQISSQVFALANETNGLGLAGTGNSGILGLSFPVEASIPDTSGTTLLENLFSPFNESNRYFAIKLGRDQDSSSFSIGELDTAFANSTADFTYTPVYPAAPSIYDYWKMPLHSLTINSTSFHLSDSRVKGSSTPIAVFDTGTTLILGPTDDVDRFWDSVGGSRKTDNGWQVRCDRAMVVGFVLGAGDSEREYFVDPADLSWIEGGRQGDWCMGGVQANDDVSSGDWLLGDTFLRNVYAVHRTATATQPPMIGLLGLTDPNTAMHSFRTERGNDPTAPVPVRLNVVHRSHGLDAAAICGISGAAGFVFGTLLAVVLCIWFTRRPNKY